MPYPLKSVLTFFLPAVILLGAAMPASAEPLLPASSIPGGTNLGLLPDTSQTLARVPAHARMAAETVLPPKADLTPNLAPIGNQGQEGSCVAWSTGYYYASYQEGLEKHWDLKDPAHQFSPAFVYNQINGGGDNGAYPSDAFNLLQQKGAATLAAMPYQAGNYKTQPTANQKQDALPYTVSSWAYFAAGDVAGMKAHLAGGDLVSLSVPVYSNFMYPNDPCNTPIGVPTGSLYGGHQITLVGYDDTKQAFRFANSWGTGWGCSGYAWLSYAFVSKYAWNGYDMIGKTDTLGIVSGQVTDATTHAGIVGAQISVGGYTIASDATGSYALAVPAGSQTVSVTATGHTTLAQVTQVSAGVAGTVNAALQVANQGTLSGTITDSTSHAAIVGATITVGTLTTTSGVGGAYTLGVPVGPQTVKVTAAGYGAWSEAAQVANGASVTVNASLVRAMGTVSGTLTNATTHAAVVGAKISVGALATYSTSVGAYTLAVPVGLQTVKVEDTGFVTWSQTAQVSSATTSIVSASLAPAFGIVTGTVTNIATHAPVVGATITVGTVSTTTNASGVYTLTTQSGNPAVTVVASGYAWWNQQTFQVLAGATATDNIALTKAQGTVSGKIVDSQTKLPIVGAKISVGSLFTTTDAAGTFSFVVPAGLTTIVFSATGYTSEQAYVNILPGYTITAMPWLSKGH